jgi:hypothetical protein
MPRGGPPKPLSSFLTTPSDASAPGESADPTRASPSPRSTALSQSGPRVATSRRDRAYARAKAVDQLSLVGQQINTPPIPEDAIAFIATFLVHATLPYKDPGAVDYWERSNGKITITFEPGLTPKDSRGHRRRAGLPFGIYPRLIFSWLTTEAVRTRSPVLSLGDTFTDWIRSGLQLNPTGGVNGTITRIREQMTRMLAMKITVTSLDTDEKLLTDINLVPIEGVAAFWDPLQPDQHYLRNPTLALNQRFFDEAIKSSVPFDDRVQLELAKRHACMAIDLYRLLTLKQFALFKAQAKTPELIPWPTLAGLLGHGNGANKNFKTNVADALQLLQPLYPGAKAEPRHGGLLVRPGSPHIPVKPKRRLPAAANAPGTALALPAGSRDPSSSSEP